MAEQQTGVSTGWFQVFLADGAAGVRQQPRISRRVLKLPTVTHVPVGGGAWRIFSTTLWTGPGVLLLSKVLVGNRGHQEDGVSGPLLHTGQVEETETAGARPHLLCPLDGGDAD